MNTAINLNQIWLNFYNSIKDDTWPQIKTQQDLLNLPPGILKELIFDHHLLGDNVSKPKVMYNEFKNLKSDQRAWSKNSADLVETRPLLTHDQIFTANDIKIHYHNSLDGGGTSAGQRFSSVIEKLYPGQIFENCFEWCSGPGFIGFDLLSRKLCQKLYLNDIYYPAIESIKLTIDNNRGQCQDRVFYHHSESISSLPSDWKFDLVIANPPHWNPSLEQLITNITFNNRICADDGWNLHNDFFSNIKKYLNPDAVILLQEQPYASGPESFRSVIEQNNMYINNCYWESNDYNLYYLEVKQQS
jgi:hypothetical protein